jgi:hypothetical protein
MAKMRGKSLSAVNPELSKQALFDASAVSAGSHTKLPWRGECGHEWTAAVRERVNGTGCPVCAGKVVLQGFNDLATTHPHLASEANFDPYQIVSGSHKKLPWIGTCGHKWAAVVSSRAAGRGCPVCAGRVVLKCFNELA